MLQTTKLRSITTSDSLNDATVPPGRGRGKVVRSQGYLLVNVSGKGPMTMYDLQTIIIRRRNYETSRISPVFV